VKSIRYRGPIFKWLLTIFVIGFFILGFLGVQGRLRLLRRHPERPRSHNCSACIYFLFFLTDALVVRIDKCQAGTGSGDDVKECTK
jgi:ubiquinol-cytochrome c reductase cytochrome b subunit